MRAFEFILSEVSDKVKQQVADRWKSQDPNLTDQNIRYYLDRWDRFVNSFPKDRRDLMQLDFAQVEQMIDSAEARQSLKGKKPKADQDQDNFASPDNQDLLYNQDGLTVLRGDLREKCIRYGQGYSWCISRADANNLFYSYRMRANEPAFYFVFDKDRPKSDPWHAVVIYVNKSQEYHVATADNPGDRKMSWAEIASKQPKLKSLQSLFKHIPLTDQERDDYRQFGREIDDQDYSQLNTNEKYKYIQFGHELTDAQQEATPDELIAVYAKTNPFGISKNTWYNRLSQGDRTYIEKLQLRVIEIRADSWLSDALENMTNKGIAPSPELMRAAVNRDGTLIEYIFKVFGTRTDPRLLTAAVNQTGRAIGPILEVFGTDTDPELMLAAVKQTRYAIAYILGVFGTDTDPELLTAAVNKYWWTIKHILDVFGTRTDPRLLTAAVNKDAGAIKHILDVFGTDTSEELQLAAVNSDGMAITDILNAGIKPSEQVIAAALKNAGRNMSSIQGLLSRKGYL